MKFNKTSVNFWAGSDEAFDKYQAALQKYVLGGTVISQGAPDAGGASEEPEGSRLLQVQDGVGVISVKGVLVNEENWWNEFAGLVAYSEVAAAAHEALGRDDIGETLLYMASPGGAASGASIGLDALDLLAKHKRLTSYTDSIAASAGYLMITPAKERFAGPMAMIGSIGVIYKHFEFSKMYADKGVGVTVMRAGEFKQLNNSEEVLSPRAKEEINGHLQHMYGVFVQMAADRLGVSYQKMDSMADGREFIGQQAVDMGLIDGVESFETVFSRIATRVAKSGGTQMKKQNLGAMAAAMAAAGIAGVAVKAEQPEIKAEQPEIKAEQPEIKVEQPEIKVEPSELELMGEKVKMLTDELTVAKMGITALKAEFDSQSEAAAAMKGILISVVNNMQVALGGSADILADVEVKALIEKYSATVSKFTEEFKVGGVASTASEEGSAPSSEKVGLTSFEQVQLKAARILKS